MVAYHDPATPRKGKMGASKWESVGAAVGITAHEAKVIVSRIYQRQNYRNTGRGIKHRKRRGSSSG